VGENVVRGTGPPRGAGSSGRGVPEQPATPLPEDGPSEEAVAELVEELGAPQKATREEAEKKLIALGPKVVDPCPDLAHESRIAGIPSQTSDCSQSGDLIEVIADG